jgi:hypothetical protein
VAESGIFRTQHSADSTSTAQSLEAAAG